MTQIADVQPSLIDDLDDTLARLRLVAAGDAPAALDQAPDVRAPHILRLQTAFGLSAYETRILLLCIGAELLPEAAELCGQLHGHAARTRPSFRLADALYRCGDWQAYTAESPLRRWELVALEPGAPLLDAGLHLPEFILGYVCGAPCRDERLALYLKPLGEGGVPEHPLAGTMASLWLDALDAGEPHPLIQLHGSTRGIRRDIVRSLADSLDIGADRIAAEDIPHDPGERAKLAQLLQRELCLTQRCVLVEADRPGGPPADRCETAAIALAESAGAFVILSTPERVDLRRPDSVALQAGPPGLAHRRAIWRHVLDQADTAPADPMLDGLRIDTDTARAAATLAAARSPGPDPDPHALHQAAREAFRGPLDTLAERVEPGLALSDLVLPARTHDILDRICQDARHQEDVLADWGFASRLARGRGLAVMFAGPSGVGKTSAAEALAQALDLDLYRIDLSRVISKYIGETEQRLSRIFDAAESGAAMLLFDEGEALFGKRTEVRDGRDRYANQEVSYLLQRMEAFAGIAVLTTNQRDAIDTAFLRRFRYLVEFASPERAERADMWRRAFPPQTPVEALDVERLADLNLSGGLIRNIAFQAALIARARGGKTGIVTMADIKSAALQEYRKMRRTPTLEEDAVWSPENKKNA